MNTIVSGQNGQDLVWLLRFFARQENLDALPSRFENIHEFWAAGIEAAAESPAEYLAWCLLASLDRVCGGMAEILSPEEERIYELLNELRVLLGQVVLLEPCNDVIFKYQSGSEIEVLLNLVSRLAQLGLDALQVTVDEDCDLSVEYFFENYGFESDTPVR